MPVDIPAPPEKNIKPYVKHYVLSTQKPYMEMVGFFLALDFHMYSRLSTCYRSVGMGGGRWMAGAVDFDTIRLELLELQILRNVNVLSVYKKKRTDSMQKKNLLKPNSENQNRRRTRNKKFIQNSQTKQENTARKKSSSQKN